MRVSQHSLCRSSQPAQPVAATCSCLRRSYRPPPRPSVAALLPWFRCSSSMSECLLSSSSARTRVPSRWCRPRRLRVRLLPCAPPRRRRVVVLVVSFPWWCGGASALPGSSSFSSSNVVVLVLNVSKKSNIAGARNGAPVCALDCYCMGVVSIQSKRATWTRFSLQPSTNPGGQSRKPDEALLWTPPGSITSQIDPACF